MGELIKIGEFINRMEAGQAKGLLEGAKIDSVIQADDLAGFRPHLTLTGNQVALLVSQKDVEKAKEILKVLEIPENNQDDQELEILKLESKSTSIKGSIIFSIIVAALGTLSIIKSFNYTGQQKIPLIAVGILLFLIAFGMSFTIKGQIEAKKRLEKLRNKKTV